MLIWLYLLIPSAAIWLATGPVQGTAWQLPILIGSKIALLAIPFYYRNTTADSWNYKGTLKQLLIGCATGLLLAANLAVIYFIFADTLDLKAFRDGVARLGVNSVTTYVLMATFWSFINAFTEEVFWRWYAIGQLKKWFKPSYAILISAVFFSLHHGIATSLYFPGWMVAGAMFATCFAGVLWGWLYQKDKTIFTPFISHIIADIAIFSFGYVLMFG